MEIGAYEYTMLGILRTVFAVGLLSRGAERPTVLLGTGAGLIPGATLYRTLIEAVAIFSDIGYDGPALPAASSLSEYRRQSHMNLDSNVAYWSSAENGDKKRAFMRDMVEGEVSSTHWRTTSRRSTRRLD